MASPGDESLPLEYSESSAKRRAPKKLQNIGLGQFRNQGVAHHFQPGSAAAIFNKQKAEQRMDAWLRERPAKTPQEKEKGKKKAEKSAKSKKDEATSTTTKDAGVDGSNGDLSTGPTVAVAQMGQDKPATEPVKPQDQTQGDASTVAKAPTRKKVIKIATVDRRVKPTQGAWGQRAAETAKKAAPKAVATSYSTTPITIDVEDGEAFATAIPAPKLPTPEPIIPRAAATKPNSVSTLDDSGKTVRKPATKSRASKKSQAPMWSDSDSDEDDQEEDDIDDLLFSSRTAASTTKTPRGRTTKNSSTSKSYNPRGHLTRDQPTPQMKKRQVHFEDFASPEKEEKEDEDDHDDEITSSSNTTSITSQNSKPTSKKQTNHPPPTPYSTLDLPQANFNNPTSQPKPNQTSSPPNLADDEDSQILSANKLSTPQQKIPTTPIPNPKPTFTHNPSSAAAKKKRAQQKKQQQQQQQGQQDSPPRRKSEVHPPQLKRARASTETANNNNNNNYDDDDDFHDSATPVSKKAKTTAETTKPTKSTKKKQDLPARKKKGVATKVKAKRARAVVEEESDDGDDE